MIKKIKILLLAVFFLTIGYYWGNYTAKISCVTQVQNTCHNKEQFKSDIVGVEIKKNKNVENVSEKYLNLKKAKVKYVIDGDTVVLDNGEKIRYIGIDASEKGECWYQKAKEYNQILVAGKNIYLEIDKNNRDRYQRLLRYVYFSEQKQKKSFVNLKLVEAGLAKAKKYPPDIKYSAEFRKAETIAKKNKRGIWSNNCQK